MIPRSPKTSWGMIQWGLHSINPATAFLFHLYMTLFLLEGRPPGFRKPHSTKHMFRPNTLTACQLSVKSLWKSQETDRFRGKSHVSRCMLQASDNHQFQRAILNFCVVPAQFTKRICFIPRHFLHESSLEQAWPFPWNWRPKGTKVCYPGDPSHNSMGTCVDTINGLTDPAGSTRVRRIQNLHTSKSMYAYNSCKVFWCKLSS